MISGTGAHIDILVYLLYSLPKAQLRTDLPSNRKPIAYQLVQQTKLLNQNM